nr:MAG TPA: hypothetical protein [Caudoviricetes sp.]
MAVASSPSSSLIFVLLVCILYQTRQKVRRKSINKGGLR